MKAKTCIVCGALVVCLLGPVWGLVQGSAGTSNASHGVRLSDIDSKPDTPDPNQARSKVRFTPDPNLAEQLRKRLDEQLRKMLYSEPNLADLFGAYERVTGVRPQLAFFTEQRDTLIGLQSVFVSINLTGEQEVERLGLTEQLLQTDTELTLRRYGVPMWSEGTIGRVGYLHADVVILISKNWPIAVYTYSVKLYQHVLLPLEIQIASYLTTTWTSAQQVGYCRVELLKDTVKGNVRERVEQFVNDYLAVNPKQESKNRHEQTEAPGTPKQGLITPEQARQELMRRGVSTDANSGPVDAKAKD